MSLNRTKNRSLIFILPLVLDLSFAPFRGAKQGRVNTARVQAQGGGHSAEHGQAVDHVCDAAGGDRVVAVGL